MDFNLIKKILEREKGKIIIIEDGKPIMVISRFEDYLNNPEAKEEKLVISDFQGKPEKIEKEKEEKIFLPKKKEEGMTIDDLPL